VRDAGNRSGRLSGPPGDGSPPEASVAGVLANQLTAERTFRDAALKYITSLVGPDAPTDLKVFVIIVVSCLIVMSFTFTIFCIHMFGGQHCEPYVYLVVIMLVFVIMVGVGSRMVQRAGQVEEILRLHGSLTAVKRARRHLAMPPAGGLT